MAKYNIYAVAYGKDPVTKKPIFNVKFKTWDECKLYVSGVEGAKYKGFLTDEEADKWLEKKNNEISAKLKSDTKENEFIHICVSLELDPDKVTTYLQNKFVQEQKFLKNNKNK